MIEFHSQNNFELANAPEIISWLTALITSEQHTLGTLSFVFCDDVYLHNINLEYLNHNTLTDIITFDYVMGKEIHGEIYISTERVAENALEYEVAFQHELYRVLAHGVLHLCGYKDKSSKDIELMRLKEDHYISLMPDTSP